MTDQTPLFTAYDDHLAVEKKRTPFGLISADQKTAAIRVAARAAKCKVDEAAQIINARPFDPRLR
jgi:hypothetical protein